jgi:hypothetical protein
MKTKIKLALAGLSLALFTSSAYAECSKSEVMKLIDKGFSKTEISSICGIAQKASTAKRKTSKWITPKNTTCRSKGGKLYKGVCEANWQNAKAICRASGGRLPQISELKKVITDCGGAVNADEENRGDPNYQSCYKRKGFISSNYWSSSTYASYTNNAWYVYFYNGYTDSNYKDYSLYVRCVRAGQ